MLIHRRLAGFLRRYGLLSLSALVAFTLLAGASPASSVAATDLLEETVQEEKSQEVFVTRSASLTYMSSGSEVALEEGQNVTVSAQGSEQETTAENETVSALLDRLDVEVGPLDMVAVDFTGSHVGITVDSEILVYEREEKVTESPAHLERNRGPAGTGRRPHGDLRGGLRRGPPDLPAAGGGNRHPAHGNHH